MWETSRLLRHCRREAVEQVGEMGAGDRRGVARWSVGLRGAGQRTVVGFGAFCGVRRDGRSALSFYSRENAVSEDSYFQKNAVLGDSYLRKSAELG